MRLQFCLQAWSAWAPDRTRPAHWQAWANGQAFNAEPGVPDISLAPAMLRRRMSSLSRMAVATAAECGAGSTIKPSCVFASRHGELGRTMKIMEDIVRQNEVSPTDFSHSVFNTAQGLFSIATANTAPAVMVVGGDDTFGSALLESAIALQRFPDQPVLLVYFDEPLPKPLDVMEKPAGEAFSIALLLGAGTPNLVVGRQYNAGSIVAGNPGLSFLHFWLSGAASHSVVTRRSRWHWSRI